MLQGGLGKGIIYLFSCSCGGECPWKIDLLARKTEGLF